jgi:molybdenum cofactor cytidylyltransferase
MSFSKNDNSLPTVVVLAAGRSERFKAASGGQHKLDTMLQGLSVLERTLASVQASGLPFHVVRAADVAHIENAGMGDSIATGVAATHNSNGWLILPADLPLVLPKTLLALALELASHEVVVPVYESQRGHPVGFSAMCGEAVRKVSGDQGAARVVAQHKANLVPVDDIGCVLDVDTPEQLARVDRALIERESTG